MKGPWRLAAPRRLPAVILLLTALAWGPHPASAGALSPLKIGEFSKLSAGGILPDGWKPMTFKKIERHTRYRAVADGGQSVIQADSNNAASGLIRKVAIDPRAFPFISWRWKVSTVFKKGNVSRKSGDDYPARIYITFKYDPAHVGFFERAKYKAASLIYGEAPPLGAISYIWGNRAPVGTTVANAYTDRVKMVVVQSGPGRAGQWINEKRNVYADYKKAFGKEPPLISGVAIMTDSDNTGESGTAWYGDIVFSEK